MIPEHLQTIAVVIGLVFLTILTASLVTMYHTSQQMRRARIRQLVTGIHNVEDLLKALAGVSLPRDVRLAFRRDILAGYRAVKRVHGSYPGIDRQIQQARMKMDSEGPDSGRAIPVPPSQQVLDQWMVAIGEAIDVLRYGRLLEAVPLTDRVAMLNQLLERQAECLYGHYMNEADKLKQEGRNNQARSRIQSLQDAMRSLGVQSERVNELYNEAENAYQYLLTGQADIAETTAEVSQAAVTG